MENETEESYQGSLRHLKELLSDNQLPEPGVFFTDRDVAFRNAIKSSFLDSAALVCIWHINKNLMGHWKKLIDGRILADERIRNIASKKDRRDAEKDKRKEEEALLEGLWRAIVYADSEPAYEQAKNAFWYEYRAYPDALEYVDDTWLCIKEDFVKAWANRHFHLEQNTSSKAEAAHATMKQDLMTSGADLFTVVRTMSRAAVEKNRAVQKTLIINAVRIPMNHHEQSVVCQLHGKVSPGIVERIEGSYNHWVALSPEEKAAYPECRGVLERTMGIPCTHKVLEYINQGRQIPVSDIHRQWLLKPDGQQATTERSEPPAQPAQLDPRLLVQDPVVPAVRGRPRGSRSIAASRREAATTRREPSQWEFQTESRNTLRGPGRRPDGPRTLFPASRSAGEVQLSDGDAAIIAGLGGGNN